MVETYANRQQGKPKLFVIFLTLLAAAALAGIWVYKGTAQKATVDGSLSRTEALEKIETQFDGQAVYARGTSKQTTIGQLRIDNVTGIKQESANLVYVEFEFHLELTDAARGVRSVDGATCGKYRQSFLQCEFPLDYPKPRSGYVYFTKYDDGWRMKAE